MKIQEHVGDRHSIDAVNLDVDIEVDLIGGSSLDALAVAERLESVVKEEINAIASEEGEDGG